VAENATYSVGLVIVIHRPNPIVTAGVCSSAAGVGTYSTLGYQHFLFVFERYAELSLQSFAGVTILIFCLIPS
jgi:hypothetical protein